MMTRKRILAVTGAGLALALPSIALVADAPRDAPVFELRWSSSAGGGGGTMSGGPFTAAVTVGQSVTGSTSGGSFAAGSGNWSVNIPVLCGDLDGDGDVDLADYADFSACIGSACPSGVSADCDDDGDVDLDDYASFAATVTGPK